MGPSEQRVTAHPVNGRAGSRGSDATWEQEAEVTRFAGPGPDSSRFNRVGGDLGGMGMASMPHSSRTATTHDGEESLAGVLSRGPVWSSGPPFPRCTQYRHALAPALVHSTP